MGREREPSSGVSECDHSPSQHPAAPQVSKLSLNGHQKQLRFGKKCRGLLATSPGLAGTLLAADREGTLTSAGRSHPTPQRRGSECPAPGPERGHSGTRQCHSRAATRGSPGEGQGRASIAAQRADALHRSKDTEFYFLLERRVFREGNGAWQRGSPGSRSCRCCAG